MSDRKCLGFDMRGRRRGSICGIELDFGQEWCDQCEKKRIAHSARCERNEADKMTAPKVPRVVSCECAAVPIAPDKHYPDCKDRFLRLDDVVEWLRGEADGYERETTDIPYEVITYLADRLEAGGGER